MRATDIMSAPVVTVRPDTSILDAARALVRHKIAALPVVSPQRELVGMVSEADLFHARAARTWTGLADRGVEGVGAPQQVEDVMHRDVLWVRADDSLALCTHLMTRHNGRSLPVLRDGYLVGIVTRRDVLAALTRIGEVFPGDQALRATAGTGAIDLREARERIPS